MPERYTLSFLFDNSLQNVILVKKSQGSHAGRWNGVGGAVKSGEEPHWSALREVEEETGVKQEDIPRFEWLTTMSFPDGIELNVYFGVLNSGVSFTRNEDEPLTWYPADELHDASWAALAEGVPYFVSASAAKLRSRA
jgi:8-oxo-dGTP diphosphatase